jgi:hypothetical protein
MKDKLKTFGLVILSMVGVVLLFFTIIGIGNYIQGINMTTGSVFMFLFPIAVYFSVIYFNKKVNALRSKNFGFGFKNFIANFIFGIGLSIGVLTLALLFAHLYFGVEIEFSGFKTGFYHC